MNAIQEKILKLTAHQGTKICIWGAGIRGTQLCQELQGLEVEVDCFCDKDPEKQGQFYHHVPCVSLETLKKEKEIHLVIISIDEKYGVFSQLAQEGFPSVVMQKELEQIPEFIQQKGSFLTYFVLNILDHCNLNCQGCDHFSNIAEKRFVSLTDIEKDTQRMAALLDGRLPRMGIMGGEPLLHPDLLDILSISRDCFPNTLIQLVTNGLLLLRQSQEFWDCCRQSQIEIVTTKYPINQDYNAMEEMAKAQGVSFRFYGSTGEIQKTSYKNPLDVSGTADFQKNYQLCYLKDNCNLLMEGYFYPCTIMPNIRHFNKEFSYDIQIEEEDRLNIYQISSPEEILSFKKKAKQFCRYCLPEKAISDLPWARSKRAIEEWTVD